MGASGERTLEFRLLGPVEVAAGGEPVPLGGPTQRALLALLLLDPGRPVSTGRLVEELWQGAPPAAAEANLRSYVSRLRRALGAVVASGGGYALTAPTDLLDSRLFERRLAEGREAAARGAAGLAASRLAAALALWRGPALADVRDLAPLALEAHRLDELRLVCVEERIGADLALGRHATLVPELERLVAEQPLRERLRSLLVLALYRAGRQADALEAYRDARDRLADELGLEPGEELRQLELAILRHEVTAAAPAPTRHNVPEAATSFVGREHELGELAELLQSHRLVTVTGIGGTGKTRLAQELARRVAATQADGVWFVDLTALADGRLVPGAVADVLGLEEREPAALLEQLRSRELLLVLDNCEHLAEACAELAAQLLPACADLRILATSRVSLGVPAGFDYALDPLGETHAVRLFLDRAAAVRRDLPDDAAALGAVAAICRDLDGLPLSIELAAARTRALSLPEIAARLGDRFRFLRAWQRIADPRHQTLRATMDWSYELLGPDEQELLCSLSVFAGGADLAAVAEVCAVDRDGDRTLDVLGRLVDASLVVVAHGSPTRYRLLETVREYAAARLEERPDAAALRRRHAEYFLRLADGCNLALDALARGPQQHEPVLREQHDLRAAVEWATAEDVQLALRLMVALENFWIAQAVAEGRRRWEALLPRAAAAEIDATLLAQCHRDYAGCLDVLEEFARAEQAYARSRELFEQAGDELHVAYLDYRLGIVRNHRTGDMTAALGLWESSLERIRRIGDPVSELQVLGDLGWVRLLGGDVERGREAMEESLRMAAQLGWTWWQVQNGLKLAAAELDRDEVGSAERRVRELLPDCLRMADRTFTRWALALLARVAAANGEAERAVALWAAVEGAELPAGRFGRFDQRAYAACIPDLPCPEPLPLEQAAALALAD